MNRSRRPDFPPGHLPPGAKVVAINQAALDEAPKRQAKPRKQKPPGRPVVLAPLQPAGTLLVIFTATGRPAPWSVPPKIRRKNPKLTAWQQIIRQAASRASLLDGLYPGPVALRCEFHISPRYASSDKGMPDLTNLIKGCEDALNGVLIVDDGQVIETSGAKVVGADNFVRVELYAAARATP